MNPKQYRKTEAYPGYSGPKPRKEKPEPKPPIRKPKGKMLLGWTNIRWAIKEIFKIYSGTPSFFSKKRIESGFAYIVGQAAMIWYFVVMYSRMTMEDMAIWAGIEFAIAGYITYQIQSQKRHEYRDFHEFNGPEGDPSHYDYGTMYSGNQPYQTTPTGEPDVPDEPSETNQVT